MPFTLQVQFTGLCSFVIHPDHGEVAVLLPDARFPTAPRFHPDNTPAVPHAGYLRADLANVALASGDALLPVGERPVAGPDGTVESTDGPHFEVVYRFGSQAHRTGGGQALDFGLPPAGRVGGVANVTLPPVDAVAPELPLRAGLFAAGGGATPGAATAAVRRSPLLLRTILSGGEFIAPTVRLTDTWALETRFNTGAPGPVIGQFPGDVIWRRHVPDADRLVVTITEFDGAHPVRLPLRPAHTEEDGDIIKLKVANLCSQNPLEWNEYELRQVDIEDSDFKWFYHLLEPPAVDGEPTASRERRWLKLLDGLVLPAPRLLTHPKQPRGGGALDCAPTTMTGRFP